MPDTVGTMYHVPPQSNTWTVQPLEASFCADDPESSVGVDRCNTSLNNYQYHFEVCLRDMMLWPC